ncbi:Coenzyme F420 hydrogenase/dehydrogenase, beta subunit C-terminal domain [Aeromicrobium sp. UC242_57]
MTGLVGGEVVTLRRAQSELFGSNWGHGFFKAKFSDFTDDALNETADVAVGDAWLRDYDTDNLGNNVVIVRNPSIQAMVDDAVADGRLRFDAISVSTVLASQRGSSITPVTNFSIGWTG